MIYFVFNFPHPTPPLEMAFFQGVLNFALNSRLSNKPILRLLHR